MRSLLPILSAALLALAAPARAETPMSAEEFDRYTLGRTLFYKESGQSYGVERYLEDRRVVWSFLDGKCKEGRWYERQQDICFVYEDQPEPQCWQFFLTPEGLRARVSGQQQFTELYEAQDTGGKMLCHGPDVGV
jgi:hypothetical protein